MLDIRFISGVICLLLIEPVISQRGHYLISAPKILRPNLNYHVSVSVHNVTQPVGMIITIGGVSEAGNQILLTQQVYLESEKSQVVNFQVGEWGPGKYIMRVVGTGGLQFTNETDLNYEHKSYLVFIQTDKAIYKPGQKVRIRAIIVSPMLQPSSTGRLDMFVADGEGNRVKQWKRQFASRGVFSTEMPLSEEPVLGDWNITVVILDQVYSKTFTVAEYVLPSFEVSVHLPKFATFNESDVVATVTAKYIYGKPVTGRVVVMVTPLVRSPQIRTYYRDPLRKTADIDGKVDIPFNLQHELPLKEDYHRMIRFEVIVTEGVTERRENTTGVVAMFKYKEKIELIKTSEVFKPGLRFTAFVKVATQDDVPVDDSVNPLVIRYGYTQKEDNYDRILFRIPKNGTIRLDIFPPLADNIHQLIIIAEYKDVHQYFPPIRRAESPSNSYLQTVLLTENPKVGEETLVQVNSTVPLKNFNVVVMGRGDIVFADTVSAGNQKTLAVKFQVTIPMAPRIRFMVYYTRPDGEVVADGLSFEVDGVFQNFISLASNKRETTPGGTVNLQISTKPNSLVGLLALDQSVLLLKTGNDVTQDEILRQLDLFDPGRHSYNELDFFYDRLWFPGSATASEVFKDSGVITLTNGLLYDNFPYLLPQGGELRPGIKQGRPVGDYFIPKESEIGFRDPLDGSEILTSRQTIPETWIWNTVEAGYDGKATITREAPDTITSWVITAFSLDLLSGLAVTGLPTKLTVFRPFFISLNLPYSVIRGEAIAIQVVIFNYMKQSVEATVLLENNGDFDFITAEEEENQIQSMSMKTKRASVSSLAQGAEPTSVYFMIIPRKLGFIDIKVTARAEVAGDGVMKKLLVKPEGVPQRFNRAFLVDLRAASLFNALAQVDIPDFAVKDSQKVELSTIADVMGPTVDNFENLLQMPFGCGEQNMMRFIPNLVVLEYLNATSRLIPSIRTKALTHMETGYQRQLTYKRQDGSFSAFGEKDESGSTWLTAFVAKSFSQAKKHITIDEKVLEGTLRWLANHQLENGSFTEVGEISNKDIQGGSGNGNALTAYVLIAFLENEAMSQFGPTMMKALRILEQEVNSITDTYTLSIVSYALHLANSGSKNIGFSRLSAMSIQNGAMMYWEKWRDEASKKDPTKPVDVEMTAYALLSYVLRGEILKGVEIMKWLVSQRNADGGFLSTQDTMIAIEALARLGKQIVDPRTEITVTFSYNGKRKAFKLNKDNAMVLQKEEIPTDVKHVNITASGTGFAIVQVSFVYNIFVSKEFPSFQVNPFVDRSSNKNKLKLNVCAAYGKNSSSNMAIMEVTLPSGYVIDRDSLPALHRVDRVKRVDIKDRDTGVIIYFDKLDKVLVCPTIKAFRTFKVAKQRPTAVYVYDYYDQAESARYFYQTPQADVCDICEGSECDTDRCRRLEDEERNTEQTQASFKTPDSAASLRTSVLCLISTITLAVLCSKF